jgi:hypothetical protein
MLDQAHLTLGGIKDKRETFIVKKIKQLEPEKIGHIGVYAEGNKYSEGISASREEKEQLRHLPTFT